jgi:hypothetical protein
MPFCSVSFAATLRCVPFFLLGSRNGGPRHHCQIIHEEQLRTRTNIINRLGSYTRYYLPGTVPGNWYQVPGTGTWYLVPAVGRKVTKVVSRTLLLIGTKLAFKIPGKYCLVGLDRFLKFFT